jgi:hypothetical protein
MNKLKSLKRDRVCGGIFLVLLFSISVNAVGQTAPIPPGVEKVCVIQFDKDVRRPVRVQDNALSCLNEAAKKRKDNPNVKLVLVGVADLVKDHGADENGKMRERE